ncbi:bifunctional AP-4-A phosphorylase/ADP sulfurylase [Tieghemiomyces parasiticus]|uniref:Bifunctional AP-4-A phosphorylase/ADP sulfurylase n=1 Tax=Tieghemiomyces parasiticus TaxID=78921 RepID=A0A9W8ALV1_9FUNG|nr:bifunctional AP-4-A phosphorylase/ADP sulfurylase [Tieghemiomyces parasiticus]
MSKPNLATLARLCYERAKVSGALMFTPTTLHINSAAGIDFEIRLVAALAQKPTKPMNREHGPRPPRVNPFLPYDPELYVTSHQDFHILLNKFCVAPQHLLIVTKGNVANASGASQPHKHIQLLPATTPDAIFPPTYAALRNWEYDQVGQIPELPFIHCCVRLRPHKVLVDDATAAAYLHGTYQRLLGLARQDFRGLLAAGAVPRSPASSEDAGPDAPEMSYSFFGSPDMMMVALRRHEKCGPTSINSLGYAGMVLAKSEDELQCIRREDVLNVLAFVGFPTTHASTPRCEANL